MTKVDCSPVGHIWHQAWLPELIVVRHRKLFLVSVFVGNFQEPLSPSDRRSLVETCLFCAKHPITFRTGLHSCLRGSVPCSLHPEE